MSKGWIHLRLLYTLFCCLCVTHAHRTNNITTRYSLPYNCNNPFYSSFTKGPSPIMSLYYANIRWWWCIPAISMEMYSYTNAFLASSFESVCFSYRRLLRTGYVSYRASRNKFSASRSDRFFCHRSNEWTPKRTDRNWNCLDPPSCQLTAGRSCAITWATSGAPSTSTWPTGSIGGGCKRAKPP